MSSSLFPWNNSSEVKPESAPIPALYTRSPDTSGWLKVQLKENSKMVFLPEYTQVEFIKTENERSYFVIKDGIYRNKTASLKKENYDKYIFLGVRGNGAEIRIKIIGRKEEFSTIRNKSYNQLWATLSFNGIKIRITLDSNVHYKENDVNNPDFGKLKESKPLPEGKYKIMTPMYPKDKSVTEDYRKANKNLKYDMVWFPIEYKPTYNSNFIHVGNVSYGCITCYQLDKWNDLYAYLIRHRLDKDGLYVGTLVIEK